MNNNAMVEVKGARKAYGTLEVLKGIDLSVSRGRSSLSSARVALAKVPCCDRSTISKCSMAVKSGWMVLRSTGP